MSWPQPHNRLPLRKRMRALAFVMVAALVAIGAAMAASTHTTVAPSNNSLPSIGGAANVGSAVTANPGTWAGSTPLSFQYQWQVCGSNGASCHAISGATSQNYTIVSADQGNTLRVNVIASNADGSSNATSSPTDTIGAAKGPTNSAAPTITGNAAVGSSLSANPGTWTGAGTISYKYVWQVCGNDGNNCHAVTGATSQNYTVQSADQGDTLRVQVTATDSNSSTTATSSASGVIGAASTAASTSTTCTAGAASQPVAVTSVSLPDQLQVKTAASTTGVITQNMQSFGLKVRITDLGCHPVSGASVLAQVVPYGQVSAPAPVTTDSNGYATITFNRGAGFPATRKQQLMVIFVRGTKPGDSVLAGVSTRRLVSLKVNLHA
jgi:hypothetical protein